MIAIIRTPAGSSVVRRSITTTETKTRVQARPRATGSAATRVIANPTSRMARRIAMARSALADVGR
jgi:hypothetical protein